MNTNTHIHDVRTDLPRIICRCSIIRGIKCLSCIDDVFRASEGVSVEMIQAKTLQTLNHAFDAETPDIRGDIMI